MDVLKDETGRNVRPREFDRTARDLVVNGFCSLTSQKVHCEESLWLVKEGAMQRSGELDFRTMSKAVRAWFLYYEETPDERASNVLSSAAIEFYNDGYRSAEDIAAMLIGTYVGLFSTRVNAPTSQAIH